MNCSEFYELSPREFFEALKDQQEREKISLEVQVRTMWETSRMISLHLYKNNVNIPRNKREQLVGEDIFKLSWDKKREQSIEEMKMILETIHISNQRRLNKEGKAKKQG